MGIQGFGSESTESDETAGQKNVLTMEMMEGVDRFTRTPLICNSDELKEKRVAGEKVAKRSILRRQMAYLPAYSNASSALGQAVGLFEFKG